MEYLKFLRVTNELTQEDVKDLIGISKNRYIRLENNNELLVKNLTYEEIEKLAALYGMTVNQLISDYRNKNKYKGGINYEQVRKNVSN